MVPKIALTLCFLVLLGAIFAEAQRDGRRRSGRRKPTTESPPPEEETESERNPQKLDAEPEAVAKSASEKPTESETNAPSADKEPANTKDGPPSFVPRGTRKPRPHMRSSGEARPRPTLPTFSRKRGPKPERRDFKKTEENSLVTSSTSTTEKPKSSRGSSRSRSNTHRNVETEKDAEKISHATEGTEISTEASNKKRFGGGATRRPQRGNRRYNPAQES